MRETRADTTLAVVAALLLHALVLAVLLLGLRGPARGPAGAGEPVTADLVDPDALDAATRRALAEPRAPRPEPAPVTPPPPQPLPAPVPEDARVPRQSQPQQQLPQPDTREQARVDRNAVSPETAPKEQEEKHRQAQVDLTELDRQQKEAEQKRRLAEQQRQQQLADLRRQREQAAKEARLAEQKLQQLRDAQSRSATDAAAMADATASAPPPGNRGADSALLSRYMAALQAAIVQNWVRPDSVPIGQRCRIVIRQIPGGQVIDAQVDPSCPYDEAGRRSVEAAVLKAQPLPYAGFEAVFSRTLKLNFEAQER
ncbi:MAG: cell envelope integrity protein TolA [Lysobacteraceae bacterium]